jgi:glycosyltransferase involved in cell wall biosynthesis
MKIALVCDWYAPRIGGLESQMRDLARELKARGHEVEVITSTRGERELDGIRVHRLEVPLLPIYRVVYRKESIPALETLLLAGDYDLVHAHTAFSPLAQVAMFLAKKHGIPSVLTEHSVLKGSGGQLLAAVNRFYPWTTWPDVLTAVSSYVAREIEPIAGREVRVLPNGVKPGEWGAAQPAEPGAPLRVTSVMRLYKRKRPIDIVRTIPRVNALLPKHLRPIFTIVGDGSERKKVEREADRLRVRGQLELCGWQPRPEVKKVLARSAVFILPTSKEALSIATLEALCAGLPAVAMSHGGVGDIVHHGREGFLANDLDEFAGYIAQLVSDDALRARMAAQTRASAARFSWESVIEQHLAIYRLAQERAEGSRLASVAA